MIGMQLTYDVLATLAFRNDLLQTLTDGFRFLGELSRAGKIAQARFIARRRRSYRYWGHACVWRIANSGTGRSRSAGLRIDGRALNSGAA
jgi:hypothetical protein